MLGICFWVFFILGGRGFDFSAFNLIYWFKSHTFRDDTDEWYTANKANVYHKFFLKSVVECLHVTTMVPEINDFPICLLCVHIFAYFFRVHFFQWVSHLHYNFFNRFPMENPPKTIQNIDIHAFCYILVLFQIRFENVHCT